MVETKLPNYKFVKELPRNLFRVPGFLQDDFGKDFLEEYEGRVKADYYNNARRTLLRVIHLWDDKILGSNPYMVILANKILKQGGLRTATQADIEKILREDSLNLLATKIDTALVLRKRGKDEPNKYLAEDLRKQVGKRKRLPVMIPLIGLDLRVDKNSPSGLAFDLKDDAEIIHSKILDSQGRAFKSEDVNIKTGLPKKVEGGNRLFDAISFGLSRLCVEGNAINAAYSDLIYGGYEDGRMVIVKND